MQNTQNHCFKIMLFLFIFHFNAYAQTNTQCERSVNFADLDINNVKARYWASGDMWLNPVSGDSYYEVPQGSGKHSFFSFDLWMGATDEIGNKKMDFQLYGGTELPEGGSGVRYFPGPLDDTGNTTSDVCQYYDRVWKINKSTIDDFKEGLLNEIPIDILEWPARNNPNISFSPEEDLAPFVDVNDDGNYNPLDGDYPDILGDQALWWVFNDKGNNRAPTFDETIGMEGHVMAYAFNTVPELMNHTFYKYTLINKSSLQMNSMMIGLFSDADVGQFDDDYVGFDRSRNMGITYNADIQDGDYGLDVPMVGVKLLQGPQKDNGAHADIYTSWYRGLHVEGSWGFPQTPFEAYNGLWGLSKDGQTMTYGGNGFDPNGTPTSYMYPSPPSDENGWSECTELFVPGDRALLMSTEPFTLQDKEQKELHFAALWVEEGVIQPCPSFAPIQAAADYVQEFFDQELALSGEQGSSVEGISTNIEENTTLGKQQSSIRLFPNPANTNTVVFLEQNSNQALQKGVLEIFDSLGKLVKSVELKEEQRNELKLSELQSGIYFYNLQWEKGGIENGKLMIQ